MRITISDLVDALRDDAENMAPRIMRQEPNRAKSTKTELRFGKKGGLALSLLGPRRGLWKDFDADAGGDLLDLIVHAENCSKAEAIAIAKGLLNIDDTSTFRPAPRRDPGADEAAEREREQKRLRAAAFIWDKGEPVHAETPGTRYLRARGIDPRVPDCVRYRLITANDLERMDIDPAQFPDGLGALLFRATDLEGRTRAVQQILIDPATGWKADLDKIGGNVKRTNGLMHGAAVKLARPESELVLAEGPETGLTVHQKTGLATWIVLGTSNFIRCSVPAHVRTIIIAVDVEPSGSGIAAALRGAAHWAAQGKQVKLAMPGLDDGDFNDLAKDFADGDRRIRDAFDQAITAPPPDGRDWWILARDPHTALALWRATGLPTIATRKPVRIDTHAPENAAHVCVVTEPGDDKPERGRFTGTITYLTPGRRSLADFARCYGSHAVDCLIRNATPEGKQPLYGLDELCGRTEAPLIVCQSRASADAARTLYPDHAVCAFYVGNGAKAYDWRPLAGRDVMIAPTHFACGLREAAAALVHAYAAGAATVALLDWPLIAPRNGGWDVIHRAGLPAGYDFKQAIDDGWGGRWAYQLLGYARAIDDPRSAAAMLEEASATAA